MNVSGGKLVYYTILWSILINPVQIKSISILINNFNSSIEKQLIGLFMRKLNKFCQQIVDRDFDWEPQFINFRIQMYAHCS